MLKLRDIVMYEALTHGSFAEFDGEDDHDVLTLMYVCDRERQRDYTLPVYAAAARDSKERRKFVRDISSDIVFVNQFIRTDRNPQIRHKGKKIKSGNFTDTIMYMLFRGGIDAEWLLNQGLDMLPVLTHGLEEYIHQQMSDVKFWNLLMMSPHLQKKDNDRLRRTFTYDWERPKNDSQVDEVDIGSAVFEMWDSVKFE